MNEINEIWNYIALGSGLLIAVISIIIMETSQERKIKNADMINMFIDGVLWEAQKKLPPEQFKKEEPIIRTLLEVNLDKS